MSIKWGDSKWLLSSQTINIYICRKHIAFRKEENKQQEEHKRDRETDEGLFFFPFVFCLDDKLRFLEFDKFSYHFCWSLLVLTIPTLNPLILCIMFGGLTS